MVNYFGRAVNLLFIKIKVNASISEVAKFVV